MNEEKRQLVAKDNALINASYTLNLVEQRLILLSIADARNTGTGINTENPLTIHAEDYSKAFNVSLNSSYEALRDASENLFDRYFVYQSKTKKGNIEHHKSRWVSKITYVDDEASVSLIFAPDVIPLITELEKRFTSYDLEQVSDFKSTYSIRLYELLISWRSKGYLYIELDKLRCFFNLKPDEYTVMTNFKRVILDRAVKEISGKSDITVKYEQHKRGRSIVAFTFKFKFKNKQKIERKTRSGKTIISKAKAENMAKPGEDYRALYGRLNREGYIIDDKKSKQIGNTVLNAEYIAKNKMQGESTEQTEKRITSELEAQEELDYNPLLEDLKRMKQKYNKKSNQKHNMTPVEELLSDVLIPVED